MAQRDLVIEEMVREARERVGRQEATADDAMLILNARVADLMVEHIEGSIKILAYIENQPTVNGGLRGRAQRAAPVVGTVGVFALIIEALRLLSG